MKKALKVIGITAAGIVTVPVLLVILLIILWISFEIFGMAVNHINTDIQTDGLRSYLTDSISDIDIVSVHSETGNTGNGNHVDSVSDITFTSGLSKDEIYGILENKYKYYRLSENETGEYRVYLCTSSPFSDNIEGH